MRRWLTVLRGKDRVRVETFVVMPKHDTSVTARVQAQYLAAEREVQIVSRTVKEMKVTIPPHWAEDSRLFWNGLALEKIESAGCFVLTVEKELLHAARCRISFPPRVPRRCRDGERRGGTEECAGRIGERLAVDVADAKGRTDSGDARMTRCGWARDPDMIAYHDEEWGVPLHDDRGLFEFLILEGAQAGLSWSTILRKRANYRKAFDGFDPRKVSRYDERKIAALLEDAGIVRNRLKIGATIDNARAFLAVQKEFGSFDTYIWKFVGGRPAQNGWKSLDEVPAKTPQSDAMSKDLQKRGFRFVGSTICYAFMQATGMVNDHVTGCFRHKELR